MSPDWTAGSAHAAASMAYAVMAAASSADRLAPLPAAVCAVEAVAGDATKRAVTERALLARFAEFERVEPDAQQGPLAGSLTSLTAAVPGGHGDGLRMYSDEVRDAAFMTSSQTTKASRARPAASPRSTTQQAS